MFKTERIDRKLAFAFLGFGAAITLILGVSMLVALRLVESEILNDTLRAELEYFRSNPLHDVAGIFETRTTKVFTSRLPSLAGLPRELVPLGSGLHDFSMHGRDYRVLVEDFNGTRYVVQFESTYMHQRERDIGLFLIVLVLAVLIAALASGWLLATGITSPIRRLVLQMGTLRREPDTEIDVTQYRQDEIGELAHVLNDYHVQIQQLLQREKEFASNVSHELRTPITNISLAAEVMAAQPSLSDNDLRRVQRIQRAAKEVAELIDTFLVLAKIDDAGNEPDEETDVTEVVKDVVANQKVWLGSKPVKVITDFRNTLRVHVPKTILSVLVANLVRNAFRYTAEGIVTIVVDERMISVSDTGPGIDTPTQRRLFERHARGVGTNIDGAGLGLSIVQRICERYGWQVSVQSAPGRGSRFDVAL